MKSLITSIIVVCTVILVNTSSVFAQTNACKYYFCSCCEENAYFRVYDSTNTEIAAFWTGEEGCTKDALFGTSWPPGRTYKFVYSSLCFTVPISVYVTGCVCGYKDPFETIYLPCCNDGDMHKEMKSVALDEYKLLQNYPNPFNPSTTITFYLPEEAVSSLIIYDITGKVISQPISGQTLSTGMHQYIWNTSDKNLSSGIYFYKLTAGNYKDEKKMILIK